jgi:uncharacterized protein YuzE
MASTELPGFGGKRFLLTVCPDTDAAYLNIRDNRDIEKTVEITGELNVDYDKDGNVVGVEILRSPK